MSRNPEMMRNPEVECHQYDPWRDPAEDAETDAIITAVRQKADMARAARTPPLPTEKPVTPTPTASSPAALPAEGVAEYLRPARAGGLGMSPDPQQFIQFPTAVLDKWMPKLKPECWSLFCAMMRKTLGSDKTEDTISVSQLMAASGMKKRRVQRAIKDLLELGAPVKKTGRGKDGSTYSLDLSGCDASDATQPAATESGCDASDATQPADEPQPGVATPGTHTTDVLPTTKRVRKDSLLVESSRQGAEVLVSTTNTTKPTVEVNGSVVETNSTPAAPKAPAKPVLMIETNDGNRARRDRTLAKAFSEMGHGERAANKYTLMDFAQHFKLQAAGDRLRQVCAHLNDMRLRGLVFLDGSGMYCEVPGALDSIRRATVSPPTPVPYTI